MKTKMTIMNFPISSEMLDNFRVELTQSQDGKQKFYTVSVIEDNPLSSDRETYERAKKTLDELFKVAKQIIIRSESVEKMATDSSLNVKSDLDEKYYYGGGVGV